MRVLVFLAKGFETIEFSGFIDVINNDSAMKNQFFLNHL